MPNVIAGTAPAFGGGVGGTAATTNQLYVATGAAWVNATAVNGTADYLIQPGLIAQGTADVLVTTYPTLFVPLNVSKGP